MKFLSTPSARRATRRQLVRRGNVAISIHALREEGDISSPAALPQGRYFYPRPPRGGRLYSSLTTSLSGLFLSTPSARRATTGSGGCSGRGSDFYPRPPRGGRPQNFRHVLPDSPFLSTPSARRATAAAQVVQRGERFLSTPSARRATAKTERKHPAFVSLYTSLHKLQRDVCKPNRKITPLLAQTAGIPVRSVPENHVCCRFALAGHQKISTLSWANSGCSPTCSTLVW